MEAKICKIFVSFFVQEIPAEFLLQRCVREHYFCKNTQHYFSPERPPFSNAPDVLLRQRVTPATHSTAEN